MSKIETRSRATSASNNNSSPKVNNPDAMAAAASIKELENKLNGRLTSLDSTLVNFVSEIRSQLADFKLHISALEESLNQKLRDQQAAMEKRIRASEETMAKQIAASEEMHQKQLSDHLAASNARVTELEEELEAMQRRSVACDVVITGIPALQDENLAGFFSQIECKLGVRKAEGASVNVFRVANKRKGASSSSGSRVIAKLPSISSKKAFLKAYFSRMKADRPLTFRDIGIASNSKIYVNESLTNRMYRIRRFAERLKRNGDIASVFTLNGMVYIRVVAEDDAIMVKSIEFLQTKLQRRRSV